MVISPFWHVYHMHFYQLNFYGILSVFFCPMLWFQFLQPKLSKRNFHFILKYSQHSKSNKLHGDKVVLKK